MFYFSGLFISMVVLGLASYFLGQNPLHFFDNVAFVVVLGGTLAVIVSTKPPYKIKTIINFVLLALKKQNDRSLIVQKCTNYLTGKIVPQNPKTLDELIACQN